MSGSQNRWSFRKSGPRQLPPLTPRKSSAATSSPAAPPKTPWLSDAEELLNAVTSLVWRALGSLVLGLIVLFKDNPAKRLRALEAKAHVLSWATLLVSASALFAVLFPLAFNLSAFSGFAWLQAVLSTSNVAGYLERLLPILAAGLVTCLVASSLALARGELEEAREARLLASTVFALTLMASLAAAGAFRYAVGAADAWRVETGWRGTFFGSSPIAVTFVFASTACFVVPLCLSVSVATWRTLSKSRVLFDGNLGRFALLVVAGAASVGAFLVPFAVILCVAGSIAVIGPVMSRLEELKAPEEVAEFMPLDPQCAVLSKGANSVDALECVLAARTAGNGQVFLDTTDVALVISDVALGQAPGQKHRLRSDSAITAKYSPNWAELSATTVSASANWGVTYSPSLTRNGSVLTLELGKPFVATLRLNLPGACNESGLHSLGSDELYRLLYVRVKPVLEHASSPERYAAIGPWNLGDSLAKQCPPPR